MNIKGINSKRIEYILDLYECTNVTLFTRVENYYVLSHNSKHLKHLPWLIRNWTQIKTYFP